MTEPDASVLQFLHLSDIHCTDIFGKDSFDLDSDIRRAINDDTTVLRQKLGDFTGILVSGDIAFAATADDYAKAEKWLEELRGFAGSREEHTYVVPGNHDVNRKTTSDPGVAAFQKELRICELNDLDSVFQKWLDNDHPEKGVPYRPLAEYNAFAKQYGCDLSPPAPFWEKTLPFSHGFTLGIRGLTSVFCSNAEDNNAEHKLVVGRAQSTVPISPSRANLTLCHHPPEWLRDSDSFQQNMLVSQVQLYGHKHTYRLSQIDDSVVVSAGAAHPERGDSWTPRYNALRLAIDRSEEAFFLVVTVYPRVFNAERRMQPDFSRTGQDFREFRIELHPPPAGTTPPGETDPALSATEGEAEPASISQPRGGHPMHPIRRLGYLLAEIPEHRRQTIAHQCHLLEDIETATNAAVLIQRARDADQLKALWDAAAEFTNDDTPNPFGGDRSK